MAKIIIVIKDAHIDDAEVVRLFYSIVILGPPNHLVWSDYILDHRQSLDENMTALKSKVLQIGVGKGLRLSMGDIIIFGSPVVKDAASYMDKTNGITSDRNAVAVDAQPSVVARMVNTVREWWG